MAGFVALVFWCMSSALNEAFNFPPTNHLANGASHCKVRSQSSNQCSCFAWSAQNETKSASAFFRVCKSLFPRPIRKFSVITEVTFFLQKNDLLKKEARSEPVISYSVTIGRISY